MFYFKVLMDVWARHYGETKASKLDLLDNFLDGFDRPLSLHAFLRAQMALNGPRNLDVGDFWRATHAIFAFKKLWEGIPGLDMGSRGSGAKHPDFPSTSLVFCDWRDGIIVKKKLYKKLMKGAVCTCRTRTLNADLKFLSFSEKYTAKCLECMWRKKSILVTLHFSLGLSKPQPSLIRILDAFLATKGCVGGFIGSKSFAYYLMGMTRTNYLFLDPHFVQPTVRSIDDLHVATYQVQSIKEIAKADISPCVSLGFLLHNEEERKGFWGALRKMKKEFAEDFYFDFEEEEHNLV